MYSGYNFENLILERAGLPKFFPLVAYYEHGWSLQDVLINSYSHSSSNTHLSWNIRMKNLFSKNTSKKIHVIGSPMIFYREKFCVKKKRKLNSLFFYAHSTKKIIHDIDKSIILKSLRDVPENLKPIDICLHNHDYNLLKDFFITEGFRVVTAGNIFSKKFPINFYNLLSSYEYAFSNQLGSYALYALDLDIPFNLLGPEPKHLNIGNDKNVPKIYKVSDNLIAKKIYKLFDKLSYRITSEQYSMCKSELGIDFRVSSTDLKTIIFKDSLNISKNLIAYCKYFPKSLISFYKSYE